MNDSITLVPSKFLKERAKKVTSFGPELRVLAQHMVDRMHNSKGIGLAANQISELQRVVVIEYEPDERGETPIPLTILVNPTITDQSKQTDWMDEGCLSIPGVEIPLERSVRINVLAEDLEGKRIKIRAKDLYARILQHEIDHTNGILITDRAFPKTKDLVGLRVLFFGTPDLANPFLTALAATDVTIVGVVTETDKPAGRKQIVTAPAVKQRALELGLPIYQFDSLKDESAKKTIEQLGADLAIVVAYGKIIPKDVLSLPRLGFLNVHFSLLPELRGATPYQTAILEGKKETGITIFKLDEGMDTGPILGQKKVEIEPIDTGYLLLTKMVKVAVAGLLEWLPDYVSGKKTAKAQDNTKATATRLFTKEDGCIDWNEPAQVIDRKIRAFNPWPGTYTELNSERLLIHAAHLDKDRLVLDVVQLAGKKPVAFKEFLRTAKSNWLTYLEETGRIKTNI